MKKFDMDNPEDREALEQAFQQIVDAIADDPDSVQLIPATNPLTNEDVAAMAFETPEGVVPFAVLVMPGDIVPRKTRTQKEIEERDKNREFHLPEGVQADEYEAPLSLDDFEDDDPDID